MSRLIPHSTVTNTRASSNPETPNKFYTPENNLKSNGEFSLETKSKLITYARSIKSDLKKIPQKLDDFKKNVAAARSSIQKKLLSLKKNSSIVGGSEPRLTSINSGDAQLRRATGGTPRVDSFKSESKTPLKTIPVFAALSDSAVRGDLKALVEFEDENTSFCKELSQKLNEIDGNNIHSTLQIGVFIDFIRNQTQEFGTTDEYYFDDSVSFANRWKNLCDDPDTKSKLSGVLDDQKFRAISAAATALIDFTKPE